MGPVSSITSTATPNPLLSPSAMVLTAGRSTGAGPEDVPDEVHPHQDELLDEGVEETFPASDPVSVKRIT